MNIPNILTVVRFLLVPVFVYEYLIVGDNIASVIILILSGVTDILDGYIARKYNMVTKWGIIFDPVADKLTQLTAAFCIAYRGVMIMWFAFGLMLIKEVALVCGGIKLYKKNDVVVSANYYGKIATCIFYFVFFILIIYGDTLNFNFKIIIVIVAVSASVLALVNYARNFFKIQKNFFK